MLRFVPCFLLTALMMAPARAGDLSPESWPAGRRAQAEQRDAFVFPMALRTVEGSKGLISAVGSPIAIEAGTQVLREGGTAADAAVATALTQVTTAAGANVSFAGVVQIVYFDAGSGKVYALDGGWKSWRGEQHPETIATPDFGAVTGGERKAKEGAVAQGRKTLVPGFMRGLEAFHRRFGKRAFSDLFEPAIWYAEHGVPVSPLLRAYFGPMGNDLGKSPEGRAFLEAGRSGDRFIAPGLAETLKSIARDGADAMYSGPWGRHFVAVVNAAGGKASLADLRAYETRWTEPLSTMFNGARVYAPGEGNQSGCAILEALNLIEHSPARGNYWEDAETFRTLSLAMRVAQQSHFLPSTAAWEKQAGVGGSCRARAEPAYGAAAAPVMAQLLAGAVSAPPATPHTNSLVVVDQWGNVAVLVHSSNSALWGDTGIVVDGVPIPAAGPTYRHLLIGAAPGARVPSSMGPTLAMKDGKPVVAIAHVGISSQQETMRFIASLRSAPAERIAAAPPLLLNVEQSSAPLQERAEPVPADAYPSDLLAKLGMPVREVPAQLVLNLRGTVAFALIDGSQARSVETPGVMSFADAP